MASKELHNLPLFPYIAELEACHKEIVSANGWRYRKKILSPCRVPGVEKQLQYNASQLWEMRQHLPGLLQNELASAGGVIAIIPGPAEFLSCEGVYSSCSELFVAKPEEWTRNGRKFMEPYLFHSKTAVGFGLYVVRVGESIPDDGRCGLAEALWTIALSEQNGLSFLSKGSVIGTSSKNSYKEEMWIVKESDGRLSPVPSSECEGLKRMSVSIRHVIRIVGKA